mgnify:FL=1
MAFPALLTVADWPVGGGGSLSGGPPNSDILTGGGDGGGTQLAPQPPPLIIRDVNLAVAPGERVMIHGRAGSGKNSLVHTLLGECARLKSNDRARMILAGTVGLCREVPWMRWGASIRDNVLCGRPFNVKRYDAVMFASDLLDFCANLPLGDRTVVVDNDDVTVSGASGAADTSSLLGDGALAAAPPPRLAKPSKWLPDATAKPFCSLRPSVRMQISLARACYHDPDIYILENLWVSFDAKTMRHVVDRAFNGLIRGKTVVMLTMTITPLITADKNLAIRDGRLLVVDESPLGVNGGGGAAQRLTSDVSSANFEAAGVSTPASPRTANAMDTVNAASMTPTTSTPPTPTSTTPVPTSTPTTSTRDLDRLELKESDEADDAALDKRALLSSPTSRGIAAAQMVQSPTFSASTLSATNIFSGAGAAPLVNPTQAFRVYTHDFTLTVGIVVALVSVAQVLQVAKDAWIATWTTQHWFHTAACIGLYVLCGTAGNLLYCTKAVFLSRGNYRQATRVHNGVCRRVFSAPLSFFVERPPTVLATAIAKYLASTATFLTTRTW